MLKITGRSLSLNLFAAALATLFAVIFLNFIFGEDNRDYVIREVVYDEEGCVVGCAEDVVEPFGRSLEELTRNVEWFKEALEMSVLTLADVPCGSKRMRREEKSANVFHEQLLAELGLSQ